MYLKNDINMYNVGASSLQLENIHKEIRRMHELAFDNIKYSFSNLLNHNLDNEKKIRENEDLIDDLYAGITKYVTAHLHNELNYETSRNFSACLALVNDIERLGDHALNINKEVKILIENNHVLSDEAINEVSAVRAKLGAYQNRLDHAINSLDVSAENLTGALSRIEDTDMAEEMVKNANANILLQAGQAMLAQANQANQGVLSLLG